MDSNEVRARLEAALGKLREEHTEYGGWRPEYGGYLDTNDASFPGYVGPLAWSEVDIQHRFANLLHEQFRDIESEGHTAIHLGLPIRVGTRSDLDPVPAGKRAPLQHIDIVVTDPRELPDRRSSSAQGIGHAFRALQHLAFIEVKWFHKGSEHWNAHNWKAKVKDGVQPDIDRLAEHRSKGRCLVAAMLLVDDTHAYIDRYRELNWPPDVLRLALDPRTPTAS
jgi:hypothetical protein